MNNSKDLVSQEKSTKAPVNGPKRLVVALGVLAGLIVTVGIAFAPKSWQRKRKAMQRKASRVLENVEHAAHQEAVELKASVSDATQGARHVLQSIQGKAEDVKDEVKGGFHDAADHIHQTMEDVSDKLNKPAR